jgi:hypothetical protein
VGLRVIANLLHGRKQGAMVEVDSFSYERSGLDLLGPKSSRLRGCAHRVGNCSSVRREWF